MGQLSSSERFKRRKRQVYGYNEHALKAYFLMNGYKASSTTLSKLLDITHETAYKKMVTGKFTRGELHQLKDRLNLSSEQFCEVFFTGKVHKTGTQEPNAKNRPNKKTSIKELECD